MTVINYQLFQQHKEIAHFCTSRQGGVSVGNYASFNLSPYSGDIPEHWNENRRELCRKMGFEPSQLIIPYQTHSTEIRHIDPSYSKLSDENRKSYLYGVDALITALPNICIGVTTADCVPLLFFDPVQKVIAAVHAGWRGTCARITEKTVQEMVQTYNCRATDILVVLGPSISAEAYSVGEELIENFRSARFNVSQIISKRNERIYLDLWEANRQSLLNAGILPENIEISGICTFTQSHQFFSARKLGINSGRMLSGIILL